MEINMITMQHALRTLVLTSVVTSALAQEVSIPDPGLDAAIREALQIPREPLTVQDLLNLRVLEARSWNISSIAGLEAARNLVSLDLQFNHLADFTLPRELTNLASLDLSLNSRASSGNRSLLQASNQYE